MNCWSCLILILLCKILPKYFFFQIISKPNVQNEVKPAKITFLGVKMVELKKWKKRWVIMHQPSASSSRSCCPIRRSILDRKQLKGCKCKTVFISSYCLNKCNRWKCFKCKKIFQIASKLDIALKCSWKLLISSYY